MALRVLGGHVCAGDLPIPTALGQPGLTSPHTVRIPFTALLPAWAGSVPARFGAGVPAAWLPRGLPDGFGEGRAGDPLAPLAGASRRAAGDQESPAAVREPEEGDAGELHPAQVRCGVLLLPPGFSATLCRLSASPLSVLPHSTPRICSLQTGAGRDGVCFTGGIT